MNEGVNLHEEVHYEENTADRTACKKGETDNLLKAELLTEEGHANHCKNHEGSGENGRDSLICNVIINRRIHIHRDILGEVLHGADANAVDAKSDESTVSLHNVENVGELNIVSLGLLLNDCTLLGECVVKKTYNEAKDGTRNTCDHVTGGLILTEHTDNDGTDHTGDHVTEHRANATCGGKRRTLCIVGGHCGKERSHGDVEHGVGCLVEDLEGEECNESNDTLGEGRNCPKTDCSHSKERCCTEKPGTELAPLIVVSGKGSVHDSAHHGIVNSVPDSPDDGEHAHYGSIDTKNVGTVDGEGAGHEGECHTATKVTEHVAEPMLGGKTALVIILFLKHIFILFSMKRPSHYWLGLCIF